MVDESPPTPDERPPGGDARRLPLDRRARRTPLFSRHWLVGRRRGGRRRGEDQDVYVDRYRVGEWALIGGVLLLSALDFVLTLAHLGAGGREVNPIMAWVLESGPGAFGVVKLGMTVVGLVVLLVHIRFRWARALVLVSFGVYAILLAYHIVLRFAVP
ncbi:MAG: DUF5658 family protein [Planctomycetota bacterium]